MNRRRALNGQYVIIETGTAKPIFAAAPTGWGGTIAAGVARVTISNPSHEDDGTENTIPIGIGCLTPAGAAPAPGEMDVIPPGGARCFEWSEDQLESVYAVAYDASTAHGVYIWQETTKG